MRDYFGFLRRITTTLVLSLVVTLSACASGPALVNHAFGFDAVADSPDIDVLDYRYGQSQAPGTRMPEWAKSSTGKSGGTSTNGEMPVGDTLYVKWRIKSTGEVLEDTVDLKSRLPGDITGHRIMFVIRQRQLWVYLVTPEKRPPDWPKHEPPGWTNRKVHIIYPISTIKKSTLGEQEHETRISATARPHPKELQ